jgi:pimeloyl-ACP methyl ester carboxylesterase
MSHALRVAPFVTSALIVASGLNAHTQENRSTPPSATPIPYGANASAGGTFTHGGVTLYYETYGAGEPLLIVHGNGGSIGTMAAQLDHFRTKYKVIAMDSRDHGRSSDSTGALTYEVMTDDLAALLDHLKVGPAYVLGWSDGGIEAFLLAVRHPTKVKKIAALSANLNPTERALYPEVIKGLHQMLKSMPDSVKSTPEGARQLKVMGMTVNEPNVAPARLGEVAVPSLVMAADNDLIRAEHTLEIFNNLRLGQLVIFPDATHMVPFDDPATFNAVVQRFFETPFTSRKHRIKDMLASYRKLVAALPK